MGESVPVIDNKNVLIGIISENDVLQIYKNITNEIRAIEKTENKFFICRYIDIIMENHEFSSVIHNIKHWYNSKVEVFKTWIYKNSFEELSEFEYLSKQLKLTKTSPQNQKLAKIITSLSILIKFRF